MIGLTLAAKALLETVLQSNEVPPPPPPLLQEALMQTNEIIIDVTVMAFLMLDNFLGRINSAKCKIT